MEKDKILALAEEYLRLEEHPDFREEVKRALEENRWDSLSDRFYRELEFGTGGMRGVIGGGFNRINPYMVRKATAGLAEAILSSEYKMGASAVIAYDSRRYSPLFSLEAARILCSRGIKTYLFTGPRPTPELSFAVRYLKAVAGIVVTASHNPPEYNGYKVYWSDGGQIVPPQDMEIIAEVKKIKDIGSVLSAEEAEKQGLLVYADREIDEEYRNMLRSCLKRPQLFREMGHELVVSFSPLHGTGRIHLEGLLTEYGVKVYTVPEQAEPDGNFPTVAYPNPEEPAALAMAVNLAKEKKAHLVLATDPDADRLGIAVPAGEEYMPLTGNQLGALLCHYIFSSLEEAGALPEKPAFVKTIVTTELQARIAESFGAEVYNVLTGFKYIAQKMKEFEKTGETYVFGGEESYGYLAEREVRDKDAVSAALLTAEMTLYCRANGKSLTDYLDELYSEYGFFKEILISKTFKGQRGMETMGGIMADLRHNPPAAIGGIPVLRISDYLEGTVYFPDTGRKEKTIDLPSSEVLQFYLEDGSLFTIRPSGTEPKIKLYVSCTGSPGKPLDQVKDETSLRIESLKLSLEDLLGGRD